LAAESDWRRHVGNSDKVWSRLLEEEGGSYVSEWGGTFNREDVQDAEETQQKWLRMSLTTTQRKKKLGHSPLRGKKTATCSRRATQEGLESRGLRNNPEEKITKLNTVGNLLLNQEGTDID